MNPCSRLYTSSISAQAVRTLAAVWLLTAALAAQAVDTGAGVLFGSSAWLIRAYAPG